MKIFIRMGLIYYDIDNLSRYWVICDEYDGYCEDTSVKSKFKVGENDTTMVYL